MEQNSRRNRECPEYELLDTGIFEDDRYFDVLVEYTKAAHEDILIRVTAINRGPESARLEEGFTEIAEWFETLAEAERHHASLFTQGLQSIK